MKNMKNRIHKIIYARLFIFLFAIVLITGTALAVAGDTYVWKTETGSKYHTINTCGNTNPDKARYIPIDEAVYTYGLEPCSKCYAPSYTRSAQVTSTPAATVTPTPMPTGMLAVLAITPTPGPDAITELIATVTTAPQATLIPIIGDGSVQGTASTPVEASTQGVKAGTTASTVSVVTTMRKAKMYADADTASMDLITLSTNTALAVKGETIYFYQVEYLGAMGFVRKKDVK